LPKALSRLVLFFSHRFCKELHSMAAPIKFPGFTLENIPYEIVVFEVSAYCYYWLLREYLTEDYEIPDDVDIEDESAFDKIGAPLKEKDEYYAVTMLSAKVTDSVIRKYTNINLHKDFYLKRIMFYPMPGDYYLYHGPNDIPGRFEVQLISSVTKGAPTFGNKDVCLGSLPLETAAKLYIPIFTLEVVPTVLKVANTFFELSQTQKYGNNKGETSP
jgi:hypothetical protein